jgi:hypothetical protein
MNKELYANRFALHVTEAVAGTPSFSEVPTYASAFSKEAFILHRLEYSFPSAILQLVVAAGDSLNVVVSTANHFTSLIAQDTFKEAGIVDHFHLYAELFGTAANMLHETQPFVKDLTSLPGGGLIVPARPLYVGVQGISIAGQVSVFARGYFTKVDLKDQEFLELLDAYRMVR